MNYRKLLLSCAVLCPMLLAAILSFGAGRWSPVQGDALTNDYEQDRRRVKTLRQARDLDGLVALADEAEWKWATRDITRYAGLMLEICGSLSSDAFKDDRQYVLAHKYTKLALEKADRMPIELEVELARYLQGGPEYVTGQAKAEDWPQDRSERTRLWFHAWQRLGSKIDRSFDFSKELPPVIPPKEAGRSLPVGVAPEAIKDPKLRAEYAAALAERKQKQEASYTQRKLQKTEKEFSEALRRYVVEAYSQSPSDSAELNYYLNNFITDAQLRQSILDEVTSRTAEQ
ncbi:MAG TPA: hypothetical protein VJT74_16415 [Pyrinomonadaceae bacterium]|nr:hypothetical protein [Pyrinomonadaceae bacterium]